MAFNSLCRGLQDQCATPLCEQRHHGFDNRVGAALADSQTKLLATHRFKIRKQRPTRSIGREIQMHAPDRQHGLKVWIDKILVKKIAGRSNEQPQKLQKARCSK